MVKTETMTAFQMSLEGGQAELDIIRLFPRDKIIYPEKHWEGEVWRLTAPVFAQRLSYHVRGLKGYKAMTPIESHHDGQDWSLPKGTVFGGRAQDAKKIRFVK